ncbi:hypothetical protein ILYODFUR_038706, partial [Ilyodon furcidens]
VLARGGQQDHVICKKKRRNPLVSKPDPLRPLAAPRNPVHKSYRTGEKGQPCWSATCTRNRSDLVLAMQIKHLLCLYRDRMATGKGPLIVYSWSTPYRAPCRTQLNAFSRSTKHMWICWENSHEPSKTTQLLLKQRFDYRQDCPLQYPGVGFTR